MNTLPTLLQGFFTDRLICQRQASPHTIAAYRDTMKLLLGFAARSAHKQPADLELADLDAVMIGAFLTHLQADRGNAVTTRNARLAAIHALFRYAALNAPEHAALIERVLAIPAKRCDRAIIGYLTHEQAASVLSAPDRSTWLGRRDHALLLLAIQTGLRVSELIALRVQDVHLGTGPHVRCHGKGRKERITPLTKTTVAVLRVWLAEHGSQPDQPLFTTGRGQTLSRDAVQGLVAKHAATAARTCPSLAGQKVTPHTLRHTAAMALLQAGVDVTVIALWLGHFSGAGFHGADLHSCRHDPEGTSHRPDHATHHQTRPLPRVRCHVGLPGRPLIMPTTSGPSPHLTRDNAERSA